VFDESAKDELKDLSLNDCLEKGHSPHVNIDIIYPIGIVANVRKAFHQIIVKLDDRNMLKFLWFDDTELANPQIIQYHFQHFVFRLIQLFQLKPFITMSLAI